MLCHGVRILPSPGSPGAHFVPRRVPAAYAHGALTWRHPMISPWQHRPPWSLRTNQGRLQRRAFFSVFVEEVALNPNLLIGEAALVVMLSAIFEAFRSWLQRQVEGFGDETGREILEGLFEEVSGVGFIGLVLYFITQSGLVDTKDGLITETFETVHILLFLLVVVLLLQSAAVLVVTREVSKRWDEYERTRAFGSSPNSLESRFVNAGYLKRVPKEATPPQVELVSQKPFKYGDNVVERLAFSEGLQSETTASGTLHKLVRWRAIREEFLLQTRSANQEGSLSYFFNFNLYLSNQLGRTVNKLIKVDITIWLVTLVLLVPVIYVCSSFTLSTALVVQCTFAWALLAAAGVICVSLEEDLYTLTPQVPQDVIKTLRFFASTETNGQVVPSMSGADQRPQQELVEPPFLRSVDTSAGSSWLPYEAACRFISFFQALSVTALIVTGINEPLTSSSDVIVYCLAWAEWPLMLFLVVPRLIRRLTMRSSIEGKKDLDLVRRVMLQMKEGAVRDCARLVLMVDSERLAAKQQAKWTVPSAWTESLANASFERGEARFQELRQSDQLEIWKIFASWDLNNDGFIDIQEFATKLSSVGFPHPVDESAKNLLRLVDNDGSRVLDWRRFRAMVALTTEDVSNQRRVMAFNQFFQIINADQDELITVAELASWSQLNGIGMVEDDFANLVYSHFGRVKLSLNETEFAEWVQANGTSRNVVD
eukprot:TRINITY_DN73321_c0_g1_i1.p1 TRINITY_DN73321_c0_g1~~TRINITY_DN73321_c0_g1_i1.p1  ORF type:complete len:711 (+),score=89.14 TRINITY_DN73321_c0_g1_i1:100-2232(+)